MLHDGGNSGFGSWKLSLRNSFKNFRRDRPLNENQRPVTSTGEQPLNKRRKIDDSDFSEQINEEEYEEAVKKLKEEHAKNKKGRNHATIKQLMEKTRQRRWKSILDKGPFVSDVLKEFPFLTSSKVLRREFCWVAEVDGSTSSLTSSWPDWKKQIIELSKAEGATRPSIKKLHDLYMANAEVENPTDHSDSVILEILIKLLYPKGPAKGCIFIKKFEACDVDLDGEVNKITQLAP